MRLTEKDVLCCPPPLYHCFGLVLGLLAAIASGAKLICPAEVFHPGATLEAVSKERCTVLHGVPTMFISLLQQKLPEGFHCESLRTGIIAGAPVSQRLMKQLDSTFGMHEFTSSYGLTETSPTCFNAFAEDTIETKLTTVGSIMPHAKAKVVDKHGRIVPLGVRGELCIAGYQLLKGYWNSSEAYNKSLIPDASGTLWLHTGDEAMLYENGHCTITGRLKEIIIRGMYLGNSCAAI